MGGAEAQIALAIITIGTRIPARVAAMLLAIRSAKLGPKTAAGLSRGSGPGGPAVALLRSSVCSTTKPVDFRASAYASARLHERRPFVLGPRQRVGRYALADLHLLVHAENGARLEHPSDLGEHRAACPGCSSRRG